jgi:lipid A 3-O-deacylase
MFICLRKVIQKILLLPFILVSLADLFGQRIENESVIRGIHTDHYFRFYYENDFIALTDYYYTSGMNIELVKPSFKKNPLNKVFFRLPRAKMKYGLALDHYAFTPVRIIYSDILYGDRPYAGCISLNSFRIAMDEKRRQQISTSLILGLIGPATFWKPVQTVLHKNLIPAPQPKGWDNQIQNDLILNYKVNLEKNFIRSNSFLLNGNIETIVGTMNDKLSTGLSLMIGKMNDPFQSYETREMQNWELYFFSRSFVNAIGYDATLQGGVFNKKSPYTLSGSEINHFTFQNQIGLMFHHKKFSLELSESFLSKEFKTGRRHIWGGIGIGFELK